MRERRSVIEQMVVAFYRIITVVIIAFTLVIAIVEIRDPAADTSGAVRSLTNIVMLILGALLGLLVKTSAIESLLQHPPEPEPAADETLEIMRREDETP